MAEYVSVVAPLRNTITLSGSPVSEIAELSPATSAITITNTHTTSAIPPPVIAVETRRTSSERTLYFSGIAISHHLSDPSPVISRERLGEGSAAHPLYLLVQSFLPSA